jgi:hypothetical protein
LVFAPQDRRTALHPFTNARARLPSLNRDFPPPGTLQLALANRSACIFRDSKRAKNPAQPLPRPSPSTDWPSSPAPAARYQIHLLTVSLHRPYAYRPPLLRTTASLSKQVAADMTDSFNLAIKQEHQQLPVISSLRSLGTSFL